MADYFVAISEDGVRFKLQRDGTWESDGLHWHTGGEHLGRFVVSV